MKKIFIALLVGYIPTAALTPGANAQNSKMASSIMNSKSFESSIETATSAASASAVTNINVKAIKDLNSTFKDAADTKWSKSSDGYIAWFKVNGQVKRNYYDKRGTWHCTISYYGEQNLPHDIRDIVKRVYYDYGITQVEEVHTENGSVYIVHVQDEKTSKTLRVGDGEMEVMHDFKR
jgi:hypothetical protein